MCFSIQKGRGVSSLDDTGCEIEKKINLDSAKSGLTCKALAGQVCDLVDGRALR
jgi:hypothetical protein